MRKLGYFVILVVCLGAGLGVGWVRRQRRAASGGEGVTFGEAKPVASATSGTLLADAGGAGKTDPSAAPAGDTAVAPAPVPMDTLAMPKPEAASDIDPLTGRSFAGGKNPEPPRSSGGASGSHKSRSTGGASGLGNGGTASGSAESLPPVPDHQVITEKSGQEFFDTPAPKMKSAPAAKSSKKSASSDSVPLPPTASSGGDLDALPVIEDSQATKSSAPPPPPPVVAMINNAPGDLTFPAGSGSSLKKISQRQSGDKSVVHIERSGGAKFRVFKVKNPNRVWVDFEETEVPGGDSHSAAGSAHVKEITARYIKNAGGGVPIARVQILLSDDKIPNVDCQESGSGVECTIGGASEKF